MKILYLLVTLFITQSFYGQKNKIVVDYDFVFAGEWLSKENKKNPMMLKIFAGVEEAMSKTKFKLIGQNNIAIFKAIESMGLDNETSGEKMARTMTSANDVFFRNTREKILIEDTEHESKQYHINKNYTSVKWELTQESKTVANFICYKAIGKDPGRNLPIFAWFCPQISYGFGPIEFGDLPGLILELTIGKMTYIASKIDFDGVSDVKLEFPTKNLISEEAFSKIINVSVDERMGR